MKWLRSFWFLLALGIIILWLYLVQVVSSHKNTTNPVAASQPDATLARSYWKAPSLDTLPSNEYGDLIRYGHELIAHTAKYFGPRGSVAVMSNGMNCQNCHLDAGRQPFANSFAAVASSYPRFRERSGRMESVEFRINECFERSLNGKKLDSLSHEMRAMVAYLKWIGQHVSKGVRPAGAGTEELVYLARAAEAEKGKDVYQRKCQSCHGANGEGKLNADSIGYVYPPLWGERSYNVSAGLYRLTRFAGFVKYSMPFGSTRENPQLTDEECWDLAAYVNSQARPQKFFRYDWPDIKTKPVDYPFGPYVDGYSEIQHKYGPFRPIKIAKEKLSKSSSAVTKK